MRPGFQGCFVRILCVAALWFGVSASGIGAVTISSPVSSSSIATGQSFVATLSLDTFAGVEAVDVGFVFDAALLSLEAVDLAPGVPEPFAPLQFEPGVGQKKVGFLYLSPVSAGPGPIAILLATFKALGATPVAGTHISPVVLINEIVEPTPSPLTVTVVPEPTSTALIAAGLVLLVGASRMRSRPADG